MPSEPMLSFHIATGALALALGPATLYAASRRGRDNRVGAAYHWAFLAVCVSAVVLAALDFSRLWWFLPIAAGSYALALLGYLASKRDGWRWPSLYVRGQGGSYIALVTAAVVVSVGSPAAWIAPTLIGAPLIERLANRVRTRPALRHAPLEPRIRSPVNPQHY